MPRVRVILGPLPKWLHRALTEDAQSQDDVEVVGVAIKPTDLLLVAGRLRADAVLVAMDHGGLPGIASHLLDQYPHIKVLAVGVNGREVLLYSLRPQLLQIPTPSLDELMTTIRTLAATPAD